MAQERLQKILAAAGVASRRKAEELITTGRISVNGETVTTLGSKADPRTDEIRVDGELLRGPERHVYILLNKPKGYVTTVSDPEGRPTVMDLMQGVEARVFPVGRLDYASEGLLLMTNDGELMQQLTKAASHVRKTYLVKVSGTPTEEEIDKLRAGVRLPPEASRAGTMGGTRPGMARRSEAVRTQPARIELVREQENPWYEITLTEGRNRQIRRMFEQVGHHVEKIKRVRYGPLQLDVEPGEWRPLKPREVQQLRQSPGGAGAEAGAERGRRPPRAEREVARRDDRRGPQQKQAPRWARPKPERQFRGERGQSGGEFSPGTQERGGRERREFSERGQFSERGSSPRRGRGEERGPRFEREQFPRRGRGEAREGRFERGYERREGAGKNRASAGEKFSERKQGDARRGGQEFPERKRGEARRSGPKFSDRNRGERRGGEQGRPQRRPASFGKSEGRSERGARRGPGRNRPGGERKRPS